MRFDGLALHTNALHSIRLAFLLQDTGRDPSRFWTTVVRVS
jgi:hypothetical protein